MSVRSIRDLENGRVAQPRPATVRLLADAFGVAPGDWTEAAADPVRPRELPLDVLGFTGRVAELARLDAARERVGAAGPVVVSAVTGMAGVGKTALVLHWAHRVAGQFPDGQLYVNLRGFDGADAVVEPADALRGFLEALGVPVDRIAAGPEARAGQFRSLLAGRRILVILDNARDSRQVGPLLPGSGGSMVVVTSRDRLAGLVSAAAAQTVCLDVLSADEAAGLLAGRLGAGRLTTEPAAAAQIIAATARLPLALAIAAARAAVQPRFPLSVLAAELSRPDARLEAFADGDLRRVFSWSYRELSAAAARLFRQLGLHPGPEVTADAAAAAAGVPVDVVLPWLAELTRLHLLTETVPGRYGFHDLIGEYARELAGSETGTAARARLFEFYVGRAEAAALAFAHGDFPRMARTDPASGGVFTERTARDWLAAEERNLVAVGRHAAAHGPYDAAWRIADAVAGYAHVRQNHDLWQALVQSAKRAGEAAGNPRVAAFVAYHTAAILDGRRDYARSVVAYGNALELCREAWPEAVVTSLNMMAALNNELGFPGLAHDQLGEALRLSRERGQRFEEGKILVNLSCNASDRGQQAEAVAALETAGQLFEAEDSRLGRAMVLVNMAEARLLRRELDAARDCAQASLAIGADAGLDRIECISHTLLGTVDRVSGRLGAAERHATTALAFAWDPPERQALGKAHHEFAVLRHTVGDLAAATEHYRIAYRMAADMPCLHDIIHYSVRQALAEHQCGLVSRPAAAERVREALRRAAEVGLPCVEGVAHLVLAELLTDAGEARAHARAGSAIQRRAGWRADPEEIRQLARWG